MKNRTAEFKSLIKLLGKQQSVKITFTVDGNTTVLTNEDLNSITPSYEGNFLKSVMKQLDIDSSIDIPKGTEVKFEYGILVGSEYEYLNYGNYIVYESKKKEDTLSYEITCYDKLLYSMVDYEELSITYPCTIKAFLSALCTKIGLEFEDSDFANYSRTVPSDLFLEQGYKYRDVLDQIAEVTGGAICLTLDDKVEVRYPNITDDTIDEEYINDTNVTFGEKYGPINSIVLARAGESDKVYKKDDESIAENGLCELMISENQFMNFNDRSDYLDELADKLFGIEYYINDYTSTGIMYYDFFDIYNVKIENNTYKCIMLNDEGDITQGLEEQIHAEILEQSQTDYSKADKTDQRINKTTLIVDKQSQKIEGTISQVDGLVSKTNNILTDIDGLTIAISRTGGLNLIQNSALRFGIDKNATSTGNVSVVQYAEIQANTVSQSAIKIIEGSVLFDPINVVEGREYTFSCLIYKTSGVTATVTLHKGQDETFTAEGANDTFVAFEHTFTADSKLVSIEIACDDNYCLFSDCMFNMGSKLGYQPYQGEIISSSVAINGDGIEVSNENSSTKTIINDHETKIVNARTDETRVSFNADDTVIDVATIKNKITIGKLRLTDLGTHVIGTFDD